MPIFKVAGQICYFAHVPKCAGTSVEDYLVERFGPLAFLNRKFNSKKESNWNKSSPQHILAGDLGTLFPKGFFDHTFAVVRHPISRVISAFHYHRDRERKISADVEFEDWVDRLAEFKPSDHRRLDNHFQPQSQFLPKKCRVFKMEDGLDKVEAWLDEIAGAADDISIPNNFAGHYKKPELDDATLAKIERLYQNDFDAFGYERQSSVKMG